MAKKFRIEDITFGRLTETKYITVSLDEGEIEFTVFSNEEAGNVKELEITIDNKDQKELFESLNYDLQTEIMDAIQST